MKTDDLIRRADQGYGYSSMESYIFSLEHLDDSDPVSSN
jgi:hypothetical protein